MVQGKLPLTPYGLFKDTRIADRQVHTRILHFRWHCCIPLYIGAATSRFGGLLPSDYFLLLTSCRRTSLATSASTPWTSPRPSRRSRPSTTRRSSTSTHTGSRHSEATSGTDGEGAHRQRALKGSGWEWGVGVYMMDRRLGKWVWGPCSDGVYVVWAGTASWGRATRRWLRHAASWAEATGVRTCSHTRDILCLCIYIRLTPGQIQQI